MKRSFFPFLLAALIAVGLVFSAQQDMSVGAETFEKQMRAAAKRQNFSVVNEEAVGQEELPLPLSVRWHPRRWGPKASSADAARLPDNIERFGLIRDRTSRVNCFVRYLDGRAQVVEIRVTSNEVQAGTDLRSVLMQEFPSLTINLRIQ
jgi:hypothetical protein